MTKKKDAFEKILEGVQDADERAALLCLKVDKLSDMLANLKAGLTSSGEERP